MKKICACTVLLTLMFGFACSTTWLSTFEQYLQIAGPVLIQILDLVSAVKGDPPNAALVAKINADQASVTSLAQSISSASSANLPSTCAAFNQAVSTFAGDLGQIEQLANIGPSTSAEIQDAVGIAQAAIQEIEAPIAACASAPTPAMARAALANGAAKVTSPEDFVRKFNKAVDAKHRVHLHGAFVRFVTFGHLQ